MLLHELEQDVQRTRDTFKRMAKGEQIDNIVN